MASIDTAENAVYSSSQVSYLMSQNSRTLLRTCIRLNSCSECTEVDVIQTQSYTGRTRNSTGYEHFREYEEFISQSDVYVFTSEIKGIFLWKRSRSSHFVGLQVTLRIK
jgi:hypothetical protein